MNTKRWFSRREHSFPLVLGVTDGILTALTLAAGHLFSSASHLSLNLAVRVAAASSVSGMFVFFTAEYARSRGELVHAARQLNLARHGHLATTQLGRAIFWETARASLLSSLCNFAGALFPLAIGTFFPVPPWVPVIVALGVLGALGAAISVSIYGKWLRWSLALMIAGGILTFIGAKLHIA